MKPAEHQAAHGGRGLYLTAEQIAQAPAPVREWLLRVLFEGKIETAPREDTKGGPRATVSGLAICSTLEIKHLLRLLSDDYIACQIFFRMGCNYIDPDTGDARTGPLRAIDFLGSTDVENRTRLYASIETINRLLRELRQTRDICVCQYDGQDGFRVHPATQLRIHRCWNRLIAVADRRALQESLAADRAAPRAIGRR